MKFVDEVKIFARSGSGGRGAVAWLREKYRPFGGPAGGDGGRGGDVIFLADPQLGTLLDLRFTPRHVAESGQAGKTKNQHGSDAPDHLIRVPVGTVVYDDQTGELLHDLSLPEERWIALPGGKGGRGNARFATPSNQAPKRFEPGGEAVEKSLRLELKLLADVGLIGWPNAGKSTLLARVSAARPKIADYPFTTLTPQLGLVRAGSDSFVMADIPGLIEGASAGKGLGHRFLRHVERTALFLHVIDFADDTEGGPWGRLTKIEHELEAYDPKLARAPAMLAANKMDLPAAREELQKLQPRLEERGLKPFPISAATGEGVEALVLALSREVAHRRAGRVTPAPLETPEDSR